MTEDYLEHLHERGLSAATIAVYAADMRRMERWIEGTELELGSLSRSDLSEFVMNLTYDGLGPATVHRIFACVRGFFKHTQALGLITCDPTEHVDLPQKGSYLPRVLSRTEIDLLLEQPNTDTAEGIRDRAILELLYASGLRVSELVGVRVRDLDLSRRVVTVTGKGDKTRMVPFGRQAASYIVKYLSAQCLTEDSRFANRECGDGLSRQEVWAIVKRHAATAGLDKVSPHTLRHTFATHLYESDLDTRYIQEMLGHARIDTTQVYTHVSPVHLKKNYLKFHPRT